jgi:UDP-3-O-[3-hydroxymyristoyl] glucosamine N-acyltransferase
MEFSASQICGLLGGELKGNPDVKVSKLSKIEEGLPGTLSFLGNPKYTSHLSSTAASIVIIGREFIPESEVIPTLIIVDNAHDAFGKLLEIYNQIQNNKTGREDHAFVSSTASVGENHYIGSFSYIGNHAVIGKNVKVFPHVFIGDNVRIGDNTMLFPGVKIYSDCEIGSGCTLHAGVIVGADGFGFAPQQDTTYKKIAQIGNVVIGNSVEIGANTTIDRATLGSTIIRNGVKLDNLIQIAHNVEIGENTVIAAQTGIAGSTKIGRDCMIGGQVGIAGHITIADGVKIQAQSGISSSITKQGEIVQGSPAFSIGDYKRSYVMFRRLPEMEKKLRDLEQLLKDLKQTSLDE